MTTTTGDCGCHGAAAPLSPARATAAVLTLTGRPAVASTPARSAARGRIVLDGFRGLNPRDGLFLRAEHLALIQDYARALTTALAAASGPGVVHGFGVRLTGTSLEVSPGLAVSPGGRLLRLANTTKIPLDDTSVPARRPDGFWRVEVHWEQGTSGSAPVYGSLCSDACADGGTTIEPLLDEGVSIRIVADSLLGLEKTSCLQRRNWLASAYFERERASGQPWLVPAEAGNAVSLWSHDFQDATPLPPDAGVPLALLLHKEEPSAYELDVWAARRLVDGSGANATWRNRLAMRPWSVFLAQILQFEAQITGLTLDSPTTAPGGGEVVSGEQAAHELLGEAQRFVQAVKLTDRLRDRESFRRLAECVQLTTEQTAPAAALRAASLATEYGVGELPPAGYLVVPDPPEVITGELRAFFHNVDLRLRRVRADQVADEVMAAQHRDRIPLLEPIPGRRPQVDILVPVVPADKPELATDAYRWIAFVRQGPEPLAPPVPPLPAPETEDVAVYLLWDDEPGRLLQQFTPDDLTRAEKIDLGTLSYPKGGWAYPGGSVAREVLDVLDGARPASLVGLTRGDDRPLVATRAGLFGTSLDSGVVLPVLALDNQAVEAIVVVAQITVN
ncbi:MAG: hypothetical protein QM695_16040 [Micropruina sp.]